jgi:curved DNA-binding protein CbpA
MRTLPIGPEEAFVLSRVDGQSSEDEIILSTGMDGERVRRALDYLLQLGAIRVPSRPSPTPASRPTQKEVFHSPISDRAATPAQPGGSAGPDEAVDLDPERRQTISKLYAELGKLTHYELLGVPQNAAGKEIKEAYFRAVAVCHPDRYFGKNLGSYKAKLEAIFRRITEAHDVLTRTASRHEYDEYLVTRSRNLAFEQALARRASPTEVEIGPLSDSDRPEVRKPTPNAQMHAPAANDSLPQTGNVQRKASDPATASLGPHTRGSDSPTRPSDPEIRRKALAWKLTGTSMPPGRTPSPSPDMASVQARAMDELRRNRDHRLAQAQQAQVQRYLSAAEQALAEKNSVSAATNFRIALSFAPENPTIAQQLKQAESQAAAELADSFLAQAQYEERHGQYAEAAKAYERACAGIPSPALFERLAFCLVESGGDARKALDYAKRAVLRAPEQIAYRVTLGRALLHAGMRQSALGELERAVQLCPSDPTIKLWLGRIKRHEV